MMADALDRPCQVCDARVAEWCADGNDFAHIHLSRAYVGAERQFLAGV